MRISAAALAAIFLGLSGAAHAQSQPGVLTPDNGSTGDSVIAVPPAPQVVPEAPNPPVPAAPATPAPVSPAAAAPAAPAAPAPVSPESGSAENGAASATANPAAGQNPDQNQEQNEEQDTIPALPDKWVRDQTAKLGVLDKVGGGVTQITVPVGGQTKVGDLQVSVQACLTRPPDEIPDAAVFLTLHDAGDAGAPPEFRGWLIRSAPGAAVADNASETFRVIGCEGQGSNSITNQK